MASLTLTYFIFSLTCKDSQQDPLPPCLSVSHAATVQTAVQEKTPAAHHQRGHRGHTPHHWPRPGCLLRGLPPLHLPPGPPHFSHQGCFPLQQTLTTGWLCKPEAAAVRAQYSIRQLHIQPHGGDTCHLYAAGRGERTGRQAHVWQPWPPRVSLWTPEQPLRRCTEGNRWGKVYRAAWEPMGRPGSLQSPPHPPCFKSWSPTPTQEQLPWVTHQY